jgi:hypothetical protein
VTRSRFRVVAVSILIILALANFGLVAAQYFDEGVLKPANIAIGCLMIVCAVVVSRRFKRS